MFNHLFSINGFSNWITQNTHVWQRPLLIIGVLFLSVLLPLKGSPTHLMLVIGGVVALIGGLILLQWRHLALFGIIVLGMLIPINGPSGLNAAAVMVAAAVGVWLFDALMNQRSLKPAPSMTTRPLVVMLVMATLSFGFGQIPWYSFIESAPLGGQLGGLGLYFLSAFAFLMVAQIDDLRWLKWLVWIFLSLATVYILLRLIPGGTAIQQQIFSEGSTGSLFWTWLAAMAFSQAVFNRELPMPVRVGLGLLTAATVYVGFVLGNDWKSGWVPPLIVIASIIGIYYWRLTLIVAPLVLVPLSSAVVYIIATDAYSWGTRVDAWLIVAEITKANPIFGLGFGNYRWFAPLFPIRGYAVQFNSHSQYVDIYAQAGIIGLICFFWFFGTLGWLGWKLRDKAPAGFPRAYVYGALGGYVGTLVAGALGDWVIPFFYNVGYKGFRASVIGWLFLGGLVVLERLYLSPQKQTGPELENNKLDQNG